LLWESSTAASGVEYTYRAFFDFPTDDIIFRKPRDPIPMEHKFKLNGLKLTVSRYIKYLGVYLDDTLSGQYHCALLINKLARSNAMLSKARHFVPIDKLISIYFAIFSSHDLWVSNLGC
jgi:hypothetical protein